MNTFSPFVTDFHELYFSRCNEYINDKPAFNSFHAFNCNLQLYTVTLFFCRSFNPYVLWGKSQSQIVDDCHTIHFCPDNHTQYHIAKHLKSVLIGTRINTHTPSHTQTHTHTHKHTHKHTLTHALSHLLLVRTIEEAKCFKFLDGL